MSLHKRVLVVLCSGVLALLLGFVVLLDSNEKRGGAVDPRESLASGAHPRAEEESGVLLSLASSIDGAAAIVERRWSPRGEELEKALWVEGRVVFPPGTPADERLFVRARGGDFEHGSVYEVGVSYDGLFRVAFPQGTRKGSLLLRARYLYLAGEVSLDPREEQGPMTIEPRLGGRIEGELVFKADSRATPGMLAGARLMLYEGKADGISRDVRRVVEPAGLGFQFDALPPSGYAAGLVGAAVFAYEPAEIAVEAGRTVSVVLEVRAGATVEGRAVDETGAPRAGIEVRANTGLRGKGVDHLWRAERTGVDGAFRLRGLPPGTRSLRVDARGFERIEHALALSEEGETVSGIVLVLRRGESIAGRVEWPDGSPAEASIEVTHVDPEAGFRETFPCLEDGTFLASGLPAGTYRVEARGVRTEEVRVTSEITGKERTKKERTTARAFAERVPAGTEGLLLVLDPGFALCGTVRDDRGSPLDRFAVDAARGSEQELARAGGASGGIRKSFEDAGGSFEFAGFAPGPWTVIVSAPDHVASDPLSLEVPSELGTLDFVLRRCARIEGIVLDPSGRGARAEVRLLSNEGPAAERPARSATTDENGAFVLAEVPSGPVLLEARSELAARSERSSFTIAPGEIATGVELSLRPAGRIEVVVVDDAGRPEPGREVRAYDWSQGVFESAATDETGQAVFGSLPRGTYQVETGASAAQERTPFGEGAGGHATGLLARRARVVLDAGETESVLLAPGETAPLRLHGRVTLLGEPRANVRVSISDFESHANSTETDADGAYALHAPNPGRFQFRASDPATGLRYGTPIEIPSAAEVAFDVVIEAGRISGRVSGPGLSTLEGIPVEAQTERYEPIAWNGSGGSTSTDARGLYELLVPTGTYTVVAGDANPWDGIEGPLAPARASGVVVGAGELVRGIDLLFEEGGAIEARVRLDDGSVPAGRIGVVIEDERGRVLAAKDADVAGTCRIERLASGPVRVNARAEGYVPPRSAAAEVRSGDTARVELVLVAGTQTFARVLDASGAPIDAEVVLVDGDGRTWPVSRAGDDRFMLGVLPRGPHTVRATRAGRSVEASFTLAGEKERLIELCFD